MTCLGLSRFQLASEASFSRRSEIHRLAAVHKSASTRALDERLSERATCWREFWVWVYLPPYSVITVTVITVSKFSIYVFIGLLSFNYLFVYSFIYSSYFSFVSVLICQLSYSFTSFNPSSSFIHLLILFISLLRLRSKVGGMRMQKLRRGTPYSFEWCQSKTAPFLRYLDMPLKWINRINSSHLLATFQ